MPNVNLYEIAKAQIEKEFEEETKDARLRRQDKLHSLETLKITLKSIPASDLPDEEKEATAEPSVKTNGGVSIPSREVRIHEEIRNFKYDEDISQHLIFNRLAEKFVDIRENEKPGNIRSQITTILKKLLDTELKIVLVGRGNVPNIYRKKRTGFLGNNEAVTGASATDIQKTV